MSETGTTTLTIDQAAALSAGTRTCAGIAGVDSATMMIATDWPADTDAAMDALMTARHAALGDGHVTSSTGYGDGGYDILRVLDPAGENRGVEVVFLSPTIDRAVEAATAHVPCPAAEDRAAYYRDEATAEVKAQMEAWYAAQREETAAAWEKLVTSIDPAADGLIPQVVGTLTVTGDHGDPAWGTVELGDPCYGSPTRVLPVPAGTYTAVAWVTTAEDDRWGDRVARLGVYRAGAA